MMKIKYFPFNLLILTFLLLFVIPELFAAPGGKIFTGMVRSNLFWAFAAIVGFVFIPLVILLKMRRKSIIGKTNMDLAFIAKLNKDFEPFDVKDRLRDCVIKVHEAWSQRDLAIATGCMTSWYRQNQQSKYLDVWKSKGLINVCHLNSIRKIEFILFRHENKNNQPHEGSRLVASIVVNIEDYLLREKTDKVAVGKKGYADVEVLWEFEYQQAYWLLANIEKAKNIGLYNRQRRKIPKIENTLLESSRASIDV